MVSLERPRDRAVLGHWHLKDTALRVSVLRITEKDSERSPDSVRPLLIAISLLVRTRQAWLVRNPAVTLKRLMLGEWQTHSAGYPTSWDLKFLSLGRVTSSCPPLSPGDFLPGSLFVECDLYPFHLCVEKRCDSGRRLPLCALWYH